MSTDATTKIKLPPASEDEKELLRINLELARGQLASMEEAKGFQTRTLQVAEADLDRIQQQQSILDELLPPGEQKERMRLQLEREEKSAEAAAELEQIELERARLGGAASPEQKKLIEEAGTAALALGESDIRRQSQENLELLTEELSPSLGLRPGDTPIQIRGQRIIEEGIRQEAQLARQIRGGQAQAELSLPTAQAQVFGALGQNQQQISQAASQYQAQLRSQAAANRLRFSQGAGLALAGSGAAAQGLALAQAPRMAQPKTITPMTFSQKAQVVKGAFDPLGLFGGGGGM